jgi:hypothetical protein
VVLKPRLGHGEISIVKTTFLLLDPIEWFVAKHLRWLLSRA